MSSYKPQFVQEKLCKKFGFTTQVAKNRGKDHIWYGLSIDGVETIFTKFSHNNEEIEDGLQRLIAQELKVTKKIFRGMIECTVSKEMYYDILKTNPDLSK